MAAYSIIEPLTESITSLTEAELLFITDISDPSWSFMNDPPVPMELDASQDSVSGDSSNSTKSDIKPDPSIPTESAINLDSVLDDSTISQPPPTSCTLINPISMIDIVVDPNEKAQLLEPFVAKSRHFIWEVLPSDPTGREVIYCVRQQTNRVFPLECAIDCISGIPSIKVSVKLQQTINVQNFNAVYGRDLMKLLDQTFSEANANPNWKFKCTYEVEPRKFILVWTNV